MEQQFGPAGHGLAKVTFSVLVFVVQGSAGVYVGNGQNIHRTSVDSTPGRWVLLHGTSPASQAPITEFGVISNNGGFSDFYVESPRVTATG